MEENFFVATDTEMREFGRRFAKNISQGGVVLLYGDLGAGKTTFSQGLAKGLEIERRIISPTFTVVRRYEIGEGLRASGGNYRYFYHIDLYRMNSEKDLIGLGLEEILMDRENIVVIEWPERLGALLPPMYWQVQILIEDEGRKIAVTKH